MAGSDADLVIWDPRKSRTISAKQHHHATANNIFEGMNVFGFPEYVICNGRVCVDEGQVKVLQGFGHFVSTPPFSAFVYDLVRSAEEVTQTYFKEIPSVSVHFFRHDRKRGRS